MEVLTVININLASKRFKELRGYSKLSQSQMAEFLNVDQSYISKFETGERRIGVDILEKACSLFGCTLKYFEDENEKYTPMTIAFRSNNLLAEDLEAIAEINKIALNMAFIDSMLREEIDIEK
jgi:transcriptional regulator with XRE-family HTH domain